MKITRYGHECDRCGNNTIINDGSRLAWYNFKQESLCAGCFKELPEHEKEDASKVHSIALKFSFEALTYSLTGGKEGSLSHKLVGEEKKLMERFIAYPTMKQISKEAEHQ